MVQTYATKCGSVFIKVYQYFPGVETSIKFIRQRIYAFLIELSNAELPSKKTPSYCIKLYSY